MYEKITKETRKKVSKITLEQQKQLDLLYQDAIKGLARTAKKSGDKTLTNRWALDYRKQLMQTRRELRAEIRKQVKTSTLAGAKAGSEGQQFILTEIFKRAGIETKASFTSMFSQVNDNVIKDILSGNLYKDNKSLSDRIWSHSKDFEKDIQYTINQAILEKRSAIDLAKDLEKFIKEPAKRGSDWGSCYPNLRSKKVDYNAQRLARTSINHSYQTATIQSSTMNPYVLGIEWESALAHGRTCELCRERHGKIFPKDDVPLDHPNGLCSMLSYIPQSLDSIAEELNSWAYDDETNHKLDGWYIEHGQYFINKKI